MKRRPKLRGVLQYPSVSGLYENYIIGDVVRSHGIRSSFRTVGPAPRQGVPPRHNPALGRGANAIVTLKDGRVLKGECRDFRGSIHNPMPRDEHYVKYFDCAKRVLPPEDIARVRDMVEHLERLADIRPLIGRLAPAPKV